VNGKRVKQIRKLCRQLYDTNEQLRVVLEIPVPGSVAVSPIKRLNRRARREYLAGHALVVKGGGA